MAESTVAHMTQPQYLHCGSCDASKHSAMLMSHVMSDVFPVVGVGIFIYVEAVLISDNTRSVASWLHQLPS